MEPITRTGSLQFLKTQFQLLQEDCNQIANRLRSHAPQSADLFKVQAETWEVAARVIIELQQGEPADPDNGYQETHKLTQSLALIQRLLHVIVITSSISDAANGDAPEWLRGLVSGSSDGAE
jgi:hypothetical protein